MAASAAHLAGALVFFLPFFAAAQSPPAGLSGTLLECDPPSPGGEFAVRAADYQVFRFRFDPQTRVERDTFSGGVGRLVPGDLVVVESQPVKGSLLRYATSVRVQTDAEPPAESRPRPVERAPFALPQDDTLTFAGVIERLDSQSLVLRTRAGVETLLIRRDTRYLSNGDAVGAADLRPNLRVFIRAGRNLYQQVEAYQVIWGDIPGPPRR